MVVGFLLLIYYYLDWVIPVLSVLYAICALCLVVLFRPVIQLIPFGVTSVGILPTLVWRGSCGFEMEIKKIIALLICVTAGVVWYFERMDDCSFEMNDFFFIQM